MDVVKEDMKNFGVTKKDIRNRVGALQGSGIRRRI